MSRAPKLEQTATYDDILKFYDYAEELVSTVESKDTLDPSRQLDIVEPLVLDLVDCTEVIAEEYRGFALDERKPDMLVKKRIEDALRTIHLGMNSCNQEAENLTAEPAAHIRSTSALPRILADLNKHVEKIFQVLCHQMNISLKHYHYSRSGRQEGQGLGKDGE